jgi:DNA repair exonuclease SbcCD nuclease subunit
LGCTRYNLPESPRDFFEAWADVLRRYAVGEQVDFVLICGDFFHKRSVPPESMNYAVEGLAILREAGIPVVAIEGNHDQKHTDSRYSWLRSLSSWGHLILLEPTINDGEARYEAWDETSRTGGYIDIGGARIFGSHWYGASGNYAIPMLTREIARHRRDGAFHILMLHTDVEGHQTHPIPALSIAALSELKSVIEYVALGHTHKHYEIDNWAFNPGSIEITNISEYRETRGAFVVEIGDGGKVNARHLDEYHHRPFQRLQFDTDACTSAKDVTEGIRALIETEARTAEPDAPAPVIEITLRGRLGFPNSEIPINEIREFVRDATQALHVRIRNHTVPADLGETAPASPDEERIHVERRVIEGIVARDVRFKARSREIAETLIGTKRMALNDEPADKIAELISQTLCPRS